MGYNLYLSLNLNANGGSGGSGGVGTYALNVSTFPKTLSITIPSSSPTRSGYTFLGWSTSSSASSAAYQPGGTYSHTFPYNTGSNQSYTQTLYAVWRVNEYNVYYRRGSYGSGTETSDIKYGDRPLTLKGRLFTRSGYYQSGWSTNANGTGLAYALNGTYSANASITLYPCWAIIKSTITSVTSSVPADGTTQGTVSIDKPNADFVNKVVIELGTRTEEYTNIDTSCTFTIPAAWIDQIPESTSAVGKVYVYTYRNGSQVGSADVKNFTITVPDSVVPSISLSYENMSDNATVDSWDTLVQGFSKIKLIATSAGGTGSTVSSIEFSGDGVSQIGTDTYVISDLLVNAGARTWTATVTDKRGRTASTTITRTVYEYHTASVQSLSPFRSNAQGVDDPGTGTYITATPIYSIASCNGHNSVSVKKIEYKLNTASTWTVGQASATSGTTYTFGTISVLYAYNVRITVTDALGSTAVYESMVSAAIGFSFGMNGKCARLGGPVQYDDRLEVDFKAQFDDDVEVQGDLSVSGDANVADLSASGDMSVSGDASFGGLLTLGNRQIMKSLWTGSWTTGDISVTDSSKYSIFMIIAAAPEQAVGKISLLALRSGDNNELLRGTNGHSYSTAATPNGRWQYWFAASTSGDTITFDSIHAIVNNNVYHPAILEIVGII